MNYIFKITNQNLTCTNSLSIITDSVNFNQACFVFDSEWNSLEKIAIFSNNVTGVKKYMTLDKDNVCKIPWEVIADEGEMSVYVEGSQSLENLNIIATTRMVRTLKILPSDKTDGDPSLEPTADIYTQITMKANEAAASALLAQNIATDIKLKADNGEFKGDKGDKGDPGSSTSVTSYSLLTEKPVINGIELSGTKTLSELGIQPKGTYALESSVPLKLSQLSNDSLFINKTVSDLTNYYLKSETYSQSEVNSLLGQISSLKFLVVPVLPTVNISTDTIYLVSNSSPDVNNVYTEHMHINGSWECIGSTSVDLTNYYTKVQSDSRYVQDTNYVHTDLNFTAILRANIETAITHGNSLHAPATAQENVIESVSLNGIEQAISNKKVSLVIDTTILKGDPGEDGATGAKGDPGYTPIKGVDYFDGAKGDTGAKGDQGIQGVQGLKGDTGLQGATGSKGDQGDQGIQGIKGDKGDKGDIGLTGSPGTTNYSELTSKPKINGIELLGEKTLSELGIANKPTYEVVNDAATISITLLPNVIYFISTISLCTSLEIEFGSGDIISEYLIYLTTGSVPPTITLLSNVKWVGNTPAFEANKTYIVSVQNGIGVVGNVAN